MCDGTSFRPILGKWLEKINPKNILEWGPGESTILMRKICPDAIIISVEHQKQYYQEWHKLSNSKTHILLIENMDQYVNVGAIVGKFDLIFVDGRRRVDCMRRSKELLKKDGVLILHDSERKEYKEGIDLYDKVEEKWGTVVLKLR